MGIQSEISLAAQLNVSRQGYIPKINMNPASIVIVDSVLVETMKSMSTGKIKSINRD